MQPPPAFLGFATGLFQLAHLFLAGSGHIFADLMVTLSVAVQVLADLLRLQAVGQGPVLVEAPVLAEPRHVAGGQGVGRGRRPVGQGELQRDHALQQRNGNR